MEEKVVQTERTEYTKTQRQERAGCLGRNVNSSVCTEERRQESKALGPCPEGNEVSWEYFEYGNYMI